MEAFAEIVNGKLSIDGFWNYWINPDIGARSVFKTEVLNIKQKNCLMIV